MLLQKICAFAGKGLGFFNKQASESVHKDFLEIWKNYNVKDEIHPKFLEMFLHVVLE